MTTPSDTRITAEQLRKIILSAGSELSTLSLQLRWQTDLAVLAAPHYDGPLSLDGLVEVFSSVSETLQTVGQRLEILGLNIPVNSTLLEPKPDESD